MQGMLGQAQSSILHRSRPTGCHAAAAAPPPAAAAAAAAVVARQCVLSHRQQQQPARSVVARVRLEDLAPDTPMPQTEALQAYFKLEKSGELNSVTAGNLRIKYGIRRGDDGRVQLRKADGTWMQLKLDMEVRGTVLLRNTADDTVHVLQTDRLEQVDLSDDYLLFMLFADGLWEQQIQPIQISDEDGNISTLEMGEQQFKDYIGLLKVLSEMDDAVEAAGPLAGGEDDGDGAIDVTAEVAPSNGNKQS